MKITSTAFNDGELIPIRYTCEGDNCTPPLQWEEIPEEAVSLALIVSDPDAPGGVFTHWVAFNIPPKAASLPTCESLRARFPAKVIEGRNDFGH